MTKALRKCGVVGLGRMGGSLALQAMEKGIKVVGFFAEEGPAGPEGDQVLEWQIP
jgi:6-phosphogluconate dehydrogenase (decarboxylating)